MLMATSALAQEPPAAEDDTIVEHPEFIGDSVDDSAQAPVSVQEQPSSPAVPEAEQQAAQLSDERSSAPRQPDEEASESNPPPPSEQEVSTPGEEADPTELERRLAEQRLQEREKEEHVVSQSRMFSVSGGDALRLGAIATHADHLRERMNDILHLENKWKNGVSIRLLGKDSDAPVMHPVRTRIRIIGNAPNFQIRIYLGGGINLSQLNHAVISMVLYEYALRPLNPDAYPESLALPDWLLTGLEQTIAWKTGKADIRVYRNLFNRAEMLAPEDVAGMKEPWNLDGASRQIYEASCGVLIMSLLHRPGGAEQLKNLLQEAVTEEGSPAEIIARHFHEISIDGASLTKWWAMELATLALPKATELLTPLESEKQLADALLLTTLNEETNIPQTTSMDNVYALLTIDDWQKRIGGNINRLTQLSLRCFPGYRPIISEYLRAIDRLAKGEDPDETQSALGPLRDLREAYVRACTRGAEYLDWFEVTHLGQKNAGDFDQYLNAMRLLRQDAPAPPTAISRYLDDIERLYNLEEGAPLPEEMRLRLIPDR